MASGKTGILWDSEGGTWLLKTDIPFVKTTAWSAALEFAGKLGNQLVLAENMPVYKARSWPNLTAKQVAQQDSATASIS